ncbi:MAG TPA: hypothetical protein VGG74_34170 [Kofleriaceae bacterium]|jgi:hypothetical protein
MTRFATSIWLAAAACSPSSTANAPPKPQPSKSAAGSSNTGSGATAQSYDDAMRLACDAPSRADVEPGFEHTAIARWVAAHITNQDVRDGLAGMAMDGPKDRVTHLSSMLDRAHIATSDCEYYAFLQSRARPD